MFQLDQRQAQAAVQQAQGKLERARASLAQAQIDVNGIHRWWPKKPSVKRNSTRRKYETSDNGKVDANQAILDNAKLNLGWTTVTSPISGIAGSPRLASGTYVANNGHDNRFKRESHLR